MATRSILIAVLATCALAATATAQRAPSAARLMGCNEISALLAAKPDGLAAAERKRLEDFSRQCAATVDPAFLRRLRFSVEFPRPDAESRQQMWRSAFPPEAGSGIQERKPKEPR